LANNHPKIFYGYFILVAAFLIVTIAYSMRYSFSVFYKEILNEFGWSRAETATAFSISMIVYGLSSPLVGALVDRLGPKRVLAFGALVLAGGLFGLSQMNSIWLFYTLFGVVAAIGINALGFAVHNSYLPNWFVRRRGMAFGVLVAGAGGANVLVSQYQRLISSIGWRAVYQVLALLTIVVVVPLAIFIVRQSPREMGLLPDGARDQTATKREENGNRLASQVVDNDWVATQWTLRLVLTKSRFWLIFMAQLCLSFSMNLLFTHQPIYVQGIGFSPVFAASIFGLAGVSAVVGNLLSFVSDRLGREVAFTIGVSGAIMAVAALMLATTSQPWLLYVYAIIWGICFGSGAPAVISGMADMFSGRNFGAINGFFLSGFGIGGAIGPWLGGYIYDTHQSYTLAFIVMIAVLIMAIGFFWLAAPRKVWLVHGQVRQ
jgi:sugar phosphate permease